MALAAVAALVGCRGERAAAIDPPVVAIVVSEPGLGIDEIEHAVTLPIEQAVGGISSVRSIRAESRSGLSLVVAELADESGFVDARTRIEAIRAQLPASALPELRRVSPDAPDDLVLAVRGTRPTLELTRIAHDWIVPRIERLPGVGEVRVRGGQQRRIEVRVDPARLDALGVTVLDLADALANKLELPVGLHGDATARVADGRDATPEQLRMRVVAERGGAPVRVGDVATVEEVPVPARAEPLELGIRFQRGVDRARLAAQIVQAARADLPAGTSVATTPLSPRAPRVTLVGDDRDALARAAGEVARALGIAVPHEPTTEIAIDRERAIALGITPAQVSEVIAVSLGEPLARTSDAVDVVLRVPELERLRVRTAQGELVMLSDVIARSSHDGEAVRLRIDGHPAIELIAGGRDVAEVRRCVAAVRLPPTIRVQVR